MDVARPPRNNLRGKNLSEGKKKIIGKMVERGNTVLRKFK